MHVKVGIVVLSLPRYVEVRSDCPILHVVSHALLPVPDFYGIVCKFFCQRELYVDYFLRTCAPVGSVFYGCFRLLDAQDVVAW